jgi:hypothetical protein
MHDVFRLGKTSLAYWTGQGVAVVGAALVASFYVPVRFAGHWSIAFLSWTLVGTIVLGAVSSLFLMRRLEAMVFDRRWKYFRRVYRPEFERFIQAATPILRATFEK